jgi:5-methylcytosine-specific restriction protein A
MALKPTTRSTGREKQARREYDQRRGTPEERGYDWQWRQFSKRYRDENPLCVWCLNKGIVEPSTEVHHLEKLRDNEERKYDLENLAALCEACHKEITAKGG